MACYAKFRENPKRAIYISEEINLELLKKLTPQINLLRLECNDPITVYLDSFGGDTTVSEMLVRLLKTPNQDGKQCSIITVATNYVASAAADILIAGDYSIAYPHAIIHYHGTRMSDGDITNEKARDLAVRLDRTNEIYASKLARINIYNFSFIQTVFKKEIDSIDQKSDISYFGPALDFCFFLKKHLGITASKIIDDVANEIKKFSNLSKYLDNKLQEAKYGDIPSFKKDVFTLKNIIDYESNILENPDLNTPSVDGGFFALIERSFSLYKKNTDTMFNDNYRSIFSIICPLLLTPDKLKEYQTINANEKHAFLIKNSFGAFDLLYIFATTLAYRLQRGENRFRATDAYWLGLVNEVVGSSLPSIRLATEETELPLTPNISNNNINKSS